MRGRKKKIMRASSAVPDKGASEASNSNNSANVEEVLKQAEVSVNPEPAAVPVPEPVVTVTHNTETPLCIEVPASKEPIILGRVSEPKWTPEFETIKNMNMFYPEASERGGYLLRCREVQMTDGAWFRGLMMGRDGMLKIRTGIRYNNVFKHPHFIKELPEHAWTEKRLSAQSINLNGELVLLMHNFGTKMTVQQGDIIGEIVFC